MINIGDPWPSVIQHFNPETDTRLWCGCMARWPDCTPMLDPAILVIAEAIRARTGPLIVSSGFRCQRHNASVGGAPNSQHLLGRALDLRAVNEGSHTTLVRLGMELAGACADYGTFVHIDSRLRRIGDPAVTWSV